MIFWRKNKGNLEKEATELYNKATELYERGLYKEAIASYTELLNKIKQNFGENYEGYGPTLNSLALLYGHIGNYGKAEELYQKALEIMEKTLGKNHSDYATGLNNLALIYHYEGDYGKAEELFQKALDIQYKVFGENHPGYTDSLSCLALLYVATSRKTKAFHVLQEYVSAEDKLVDQIFSVASERQRMSFIKGIQARFYNFLSLVFQEFSQDHLAIQNAFDLVLRRKSIVAEAINVQREIILAGKYPQLKSIILELNNTRIHISQRSLAGPNLGETLDKYKQYLEQLNSRKEQLETELAGHIPEIQIQRSLKTINCKTLSDALPKGVVLIEFVKFYEYNFHAIPANGDLLYRSSRYLGFVLRSKEPENVQMIDLGNADTIDRMVTGFRASIIEGAIAQLQQEEDQDHGAYLATIEGPDSSLYPI
jgi:tetratricopeptide (TPR) repeat protein